MYLRARNHGISYLPQEPSIFRKLTVEDNILAVLEAQSMSWHERRERMEKLIDQLGSRSSARTGAMLFREASGAGWRSHVACVFRHRLFCSTSRFPELIPSRFWTCRKLFSI